MKILVLIAAAASLAAPSPRAPACTEDKRSACWIEADNQPGCQFWHDDRTPSLTAEWSGECFNGLAQGKGTVTWRACFWDNGVCMPSKVQHSGSFLNGRRQGRWIEGPLDATACYRWNTEMYFKAATVEDVTACLEAGAAANAQDRQYQGLTPLHFAVERNELPMVEVLLKAGANLDARANGGGTPLHQAASGRSNPAIYKALLAAGADPMALGHNENTPLHDLAKWNSSPGGQSHVRAQILIDAGADVKARNDSWDTPLHFAAHNVALPLIELLLKAGAEVDALDDEGNTPLHEAVKHGTHKETDVVEALLAAGANLMARNEWGRTPLHLAIFGDNPAVIKALLDAGADLEARDDEGETPLHLAAFLDCLDGIELLLAAGADLEVRDNEGNTPLLSVLESEVRMVPEKLPEALQPQSVNNMESLEVLIKAGANLEARNNKGNTPLHLAAKYILTYKGLPFGMDKTGGFNPYDGIGPQPLHAGDAIRVLLAAGADPAVKNKEGKTPCDLYRGNIFLRKEKIELCQ